MRSGSPSGPLSSKGTAGCPGPSSGTRATASAHSLVGLGISPGEHVVLYAHNGLEVLVASAAVRAAGAIPVPMNHRLTADEVAYILENSEAAAAFVGDAFVPMADAVRARAPKVRAWILLGAERRDWAVHFDDLARGGPDGAGGAARAARCSARPPSTPRGPPASPRARGGAGRIPASSCRGSPRST